MDEKAAEEGKDDPCEALEEDEIRIGKSVQDMQLLSTKLDNLTFQQDLSIFRSSKFGGKSPTRNFIKNFP